MNKAISKELFLKNKIKTPKFITVNRQNFKIEEIKRKFDKKKIKYPIVLKPINEGSSLGVEICKKKENLGKLISRLLKNIKI